MAFEARVRSLLPRLTRQSRAWCVAAAVTSIGEFDCLIFPTTYAALTESLECGSFYRFAGQIGHRHGLVVHVVGVRPARHGLRLVPIQAQSNSRES